MKKLLLNPFERFAGWQSVIFGIVIIGLTAVFASAGSIHLDGVIDFHVGNRAPGSGMAAGFINCLAEGLINWICLVAFLYIAGLVLSRSSIRFIDILGTQAMARFPYLPACMLSLFLFSEKIAAYLEYTYLHRGSPVEISAVDIVSFVLTTLIVIAAGIWMVLLQYQSYSVSCNLKGPKAIVSFIVCILLAEVLSKVLIHCLLF